MHGKTILAAVGSKFVQIYRLSLTFLKILISFHIISIMLSVYKLWSSLISLSIAVKIPIVSEVSIFPRYSMINLYFYLAINFRPSFANLK